MPASSSTQHPPTLFRLVALLIFLTILVRGDTEIGNNDAARINRRAIVSRFNPTRRSTVNATTPMQVGNGNFAFGTDITSLQTFLPFATMSSWGWKNDSLPTGRTQADVDGYRGVSWKNHGRDVRYDFGGLPDIEAWLRGSPNRVNLGRIGLRFWDARGRVADVLEGDLEETEQTLDLWTGTLTSRFKFKGDEVKVHVVSDFESDTVAVRLESRLVREGNLGLFVDHPWNEGKEKFSAPFVGLWDVPEKHTTQLAVDGRTATILHKMVNNYFVTKIGGEHFTIERQSPGKHLYDIRPGAERSRSFSVSVQFSGEISPSGMPKAVPSPSQVVAASKKGWEEYWTLSGFVDLLTGSTDPRAEELQRRIVLSRYLMRVNEAGDSPPQESGLVNNGWFGKFHMEMYFWHSAHWALWNSWDVLHRSTSIYSRFLPRAISFAQSQQGWPTGARWPKMTDPSGRSSPGEINNLLIWQQPHPLIFAQYEYRAFPVKETRRKWRDVVKATADWMAEFAWSNATTGRFDLGPPMYPVSEDTSPNATVNPAFELAYWRLGLEIAEEWFRGLGEDVPRSWTEARKNLAPLPVNEDEDGVRTYSVYEGIEASFWTDSKYTSDHPALVGLYGWLPPTDGLELDVAKRTAEKVWTHWNTTNCWGWDFPMLAMSAARNSLQSKAVDFLLHPEFQFDDVGMPIGGARVPTPYFPGAGSLLYAIAMMAKGWDGQGENAPGFPAEGWKVRVEGLNKAL
ncbi:Six-hairpin glycosidase-like protein [Ephemerocybe angulata]|uniref:Six-hairpin glycosidase-like protein n=1 Tax=Ephemerocybe angulata TaxID=980116 RepID=A0A8H6IAE5_9AGAR|nr:Six-hairpin glycosidase-like protein [Tulosesus angulatus]